MPQHRNERRTARSGHDSSFLPRFDPFQRLISGSHIPAQTDFHHIRKPGFFQSAADRGHTDVLAELTFRSRGAHRDDALAFTDGANDVRGKDFGTDRAERAVVDAVPAVDALAFVDPADTRFIVRYGPHGARLLAGTLLMDDSAVRAGFGAQTAGLALVQIDAHLGIAGGNCTESAGVETRLAQAKAADIRDEIILNGAVVAGGRDDGYHVPGGRTRFRTQSLCQTDTPANDIPLLIDAAAPPKLWILIF